MKEQMKKKVMVLMSTVLVAAALLVGCGEKKEDLMNFAEVNYTGINGKASATVSIDFSELESLIAEGKEDDTSIIENIKLLEESMEYTISKEEEISNGDEIIVSVTWDADKAKACGFKFTGNDKKIVVEGLEDAKEIDLFEGVTLEYSGVSPAASFKIINASKDPYVKGISFLTDKIPGINRDIANGDQMVVTADCSEEELNKKGYMADTFEKTFTVEGIDEYISAYDKIDKETLEKIDVQSKDIINARLAYSSFYKDMYPDEYLPMNFDFDTAKVTEIILDKSYFLSMKKGHTNIMNSRYNVLYNVYKVTTTDEVSPNGKVAYFVIAYDDFILRNTGKIDVVVTDGYRAGSSYTTNSDDLYRDMVTLDADAYISEEITY